MGRRKNLDQKVLRLSDLFRQPNNEKEPCLECKTLVLNINYGHNRKLLKKCRRLEEYAIFVDMIRQNQAKGAKLREAVETAAENCISRGILTDILSAQKAEVVQMVLEGFDQEAYEKAMKQEGYEDGYLDGEKAGYDSGRKEEKERGNLRTDPLFAGFGCRQGSDYPRTPGYLPAYRDGDERLPEKILVIPSRHFSEREDR